MICEFLLSRRVGERSGRVLSTKTLRKYFMPMSRFHLRLFNLRGDQDKSAFSVKKRHSFYTNSYSGDQRSSSNGICKSDANISYIVDTGIAGSDDLTRSDMNREYYKKYEHDVTPVRDDSSYNDHSFSEDNDCRTGDNKDSITNSDLDKLEMKILRKMSQELQTDDSSENHLDSNIKLFKTTVQQIFDNFYNNMQDFELYKKKFNDILEKNKEYSFSEMEIFIKDVLQNIGSSQSSISNNSVTKNPTIDQDTKEILSNGYRINVNKNTKTKVSSLNSTMETFLNDHYLTDSTFENNSSNINSGFKTEETVNIYFSGSPCVEIKMNNRDMLSEINIRDHNVDRIVNQIASAENVDKLAAKKLQLENYAKQQRECHSCDRDIPVKVFNAKKNIHLDEDFVCDEKEESKFFIFKICNYICRKFRKNSFG